MSWKKCAGSKTPENKLTVSPDIFVPLPCLRCGRPAVLVSFMFPVVGRDTLTCRACEAEHYLAVERLGSKFNVCYQRYTLRYPLGFYDEGEMPPVALLRGCKDFGESTSDAFFGPILVLPRKKRFSSLEVETIWNATDGACHLCGHRWRLGDRGVRGWHVDHVIPNIGGGTETECTPNFRVACAVCNLKKGRGYTQAQVKLGVRRLVEQFLSWTIEP